MEFLCKPTDNASVKLTQGYKNDILLLDIDLTYPAPTAPAILDIGFAIPCTNIYSIWSPTTGYNRQNNPHWARNSTRARLASGAPIHQLISAEGKNTLTVALSDAMTPTEIITSVHERTAMEEINVRFFTEPIAPITEYKATIYIDTRAVPYFKAIQDAEKYWATDCGYPSAYIPEHARLPMYSCWYSFHHDIKVDEVLKQCRLAKELGMESVIVDDGWQTDLMDGSYAYCGDWEPSDKKVPDMKKFVEAVHETGMKFILWFSVAFLGRFSKAYEKYKDMVLGYMWDDCAILDPRYPEVRRYLTEIYKNAVNEWGLDGVKLDFIDAFRLFSETKFDDPRLDCTSLEVGVDRLLNDITRELRSANPDILIEFRHSYFGPTIRKYGNMIRVGDCPNDSLANHVQGIDLRLSLGKTPVHSDMLMWHPDDSVESAAKQVICTLFTVPQISVLLDKLNDEHKKMLRFWLNYQNSNRDILLDGKFSADNPELLYSLVKSEKNGNIIAVAHSKPIITVGNFERLDFINASGEMGLAVRITESMEPKQYTVYNCMGDVIETGVIGGNAGLFDFDVPQCGMVRIE